MMTLDMEGIEYCEGTDYVQKVVTSYSGDFKRPACLIFKLKTPTTLKTERNCNYIRLLIGLQDKR